MSGKGLLPLPVLAVPLPKPCPVPVPEPLPAASFPLPALPLPVPVPVPAPLPASDGAPVPPSALFPLPAKGPVPAPVAPPTPGAPFAAVPPPAWPAEVEPVGDTVKLPCNSPGGITEGVAFGVGRASTTTMLCVPLGAMAGGTGGGASLGIAAGAGAVATAFSEFSALDAGNGSLGVSTFGNCCGRLSGGVITASAAGAREEFPAAARGPPAQA